MAGRATEGARAGASDYYGSRMSEGGEGYISEQEQTLPQVDWRRWITRWDAMQTAYLPFREERFNIMLDVVETVLGDDSWRSIWHVVPAPSVSDCSRVSRRRAVSRWTMIPPCLRSGGGRLGDADGRLRWVEADLREPAWIERLGEDAASTLCSQRRRCTGSTLAHSPPLRAIGRAHAARRSRAQWRPYAFPPHLPTFRPWLRHYIAAAAHARFGEREGASGSDWRAWWAELSHASQVSSHSCVERERRFASVSETRHGTNADWQGRREGWDEPCHERCQNDAAGETTTQFRPRLTNRRGT